MSVILSLAVSGCEKDTRGIQPGVVEECRVAVVLPFSDGLEAHWKRCLALCSDNLNKASQQNGSGIKLVFDFYDEESPELTETVKALAEDESVSAVIGGLYSANALVMANTLSKADKPFFTIATTEQLVRAYSSWGNLWAMTESDITQCEVLLSKAIQYGAKKVALITDKNSPYGQTFINWFSFQAIELGLEDSIVYEYDDDLAEQATAAVNSDADFLICAPPSYYDLGEILEIYHKSDQHVHLLASDVAYGANVLTQFGRQVEGIEGVGYGANPESGFEIAYKVYFGTELTSGEAQIYDAAMLIGYARYLMLLNKDQITFREAMRQLLSGADAVSCTWRTEDMRKILHLLESGGHPDIAGASGSLDFDTKVYTNVLSTTYYNYLIYDNHYIILDYNSTDGSRRSEPTLAGWNWKATHMQDIEDKPSAISYPPLDQKWALLVATSRGWSNYRHQVDVLNIYQQLRLNGYDDDHIVLIIEDDLAYNSSNPHPGILVSRNVGENVYRNPEIDYHPRNLSPSDIGDILMGRKSEKLPQVIQADTDDNIFLFWSGHGNPGKLSWLEDKKGMTTAMMDGIMTDLENSERGFRKMTGFIETCYSGSVFKVADKHNRMLFFTAANDKETSKADEYNYEIDVWMSNRFTATLQDCFAKDPDMSMRDLYYRLFQSTTGSHVCVYGADGYGSLYSTYLDEILTPPVTPDEDED